MQGSQKFLAALFALVSCGVLLSPASAAETASISGHVIDAASGLPLQGVVVITEGPAALTGTTNANGGFVIRGLPGGWYILVTKLTGYESTSSDAIAVGEGQSAQVTMSMQRSQAGAGARVIGRTTIRASQALQKASMISQSVNAAAAEKQGLYRAADVLRVLPAVINDSSDTATWGDDVTLDVRGIGSLETTTLIDGHPTGANLGGYNFSISPIFGLRDVNVIYGSGGGDLYGVDAIGGVVDMQTLEPTVQPNVSFTQGWGSFSKLTSAFHATGTLPGGRLGYALAFGTQGQDGVIHHASFFQPGAAFDQSSSNPAIVALGIYPDDSAITNKGGLAKFRWAFTPNENLTVTAFANAWYDNKTGNGDGDYLPFDTALQSGADKLAAYSPPNSTPPFTANNLPNCPAGTFAATNAAGWPNGYMPDGVTPDGGFLCQTPQQWANFNTGYQGAGPAWQSLNNYDYSLRWNLTQGNSTFTVNAFTNRYFHTYDRTFTLPFPNSPFWYNDTVTSTGFTASDNVATDNNDFGFGFYYNNYAYRFFRGGSDNGQPYSMEDAFFVRDAFHPAASPLTAYLNVWLKDSSITNTNHIDPRLSIVYSRHNDVVRAAVGATSTQPTASDLAPFSENSIGALAGHNICGNQLISVGSSPVTDLRPERGVDTELSWGHRFYEDSQIQVTAYDANVYGKIYSSTLPFSQIGTGGIPGSVLAQYENLLIGSCGYTPAQVLQFLGVSGDLNLGRTTARGIDVNGRQRISRGLFADYTYAITSSLLQSADASVLQNNLTLIPGSQLPFVPLHTYSVALDYQTPRNYEARIVDYWTSQNNAKNRPAFSWANLLLSAPAGPGSFNVNVYNVFQQNVDIRGLIGEGVPHPLNQYAGPSSYEPLTGAAASELFGLTPRTIEFSYTVHTK